MKGNLRRIEDALNQLNQKKTTDAQNQAAPKPPAMPTAAVSFDLHKGTVQKSTVQKSTAQSAAPKLPVPPAPVESQTGDTILNLPKLKTPSFTSHRNSVNPALSTSLLAEIQTVAQGWQTELATLVRQIQDLYLEGPIVDGWLESAADPQSSSAVLRHAEIDRLMKYIDELATQAQSDGLESSHPGYRLCGVNAEGQLWTCPCPPEQVASVSLAIARHQRLRQMLSRKQELESRLNHLSESLVVLRSQIKEG